MDILDFLKRLNWSPRNGIVYKSWIKSPYEYIKGVKYYSTGYNHWFEVIIHKNGKQYKGTFLVQNDKTTIHFSENNYESWGDQHVLNKKYEVIIVPTKKCRFEKHTEIVPMAGQGRNYGKVTTYDVFVEE